MKIMRSSLALARHVTGISLFYLIGLFWSIIALFTGKGETPQIQGNIEKTKTTVDSFWSRHTVIGINLAWVKTAYQSERYLKWRFKVYPMFQELMNLWGNHDEQVILDYGCGPGNDIVGFLTHTKAHKVIGIDVSEKALKFAANRIAIHHIDNRRVGLIHISDSGTKDHVALPIDNESIDYIYSEGVIHHTTDPQHILNEFNRILRQGGQACIMIYNYDSIWLHLSIAYDQMILKGKFPNMGIREAFAKTTDTTECPIARCYTPNEFGGLCANAGFDWEFVGGYFSEKELPLYKSLRHQAMFDIRLAEEHRQFLRQLQSDGKYPLYKGLYAGVGGVYNLIKK